MSHRRTIAAVYLAIAASTIWVLPAGAIADAPVMLPRGEGMNLTIVEPVDAHTLVVKTDPTCQNWFAGTLAALRTDAPTRVGMSLTGTGVLGTASNVSKWANLRPVTTYADPGRGESYECFSKGDDGVWRSTDPLKVGDAAIAGKGATPDQSAVPAEAATHFLSRDGKRWEPWREVERTEVDQALNTFRIKHTFARQTATVAMRVPCTYAYVQALLQRVQAARLAGVTVASAGECTATVQQPGQMSYRRHIPMVRLAAKADVNANAPVDRPTVVVYAREHGTEPDGSWAVVGLLGWLLSDDAEAQRARQAADWLLYPMVDPDGAVESTMRRGDDFVAVDPVRREASAIALRTVEWIDAGHTVDLVVNLHNVESGEGKNLECPVVEPLQMAEVKDFNRRLFAAAAKAGYTTGDPNGWQQGALAFRYSGWCTRRFSSLGLVFELNSRSAQSLSLTELQRLGALLGRELAAYMQTEQFAAVHTRAKAALAKRKTDREERWTRKGITPATRTPYELFCLGY